MSARNADGCLSVGHGPARACVLLVLVNRGKTARGCAIGGVKNTHARVVCGVRTWGACAGGPRFFDSCRADGSCSRHCSSWRCRRARWRRWRWRRGWWWRRRRNRQCGRACIDRSHHLRIGRAGRARTTRKHAKHQQHAKPTFHTVYPHPDCPRLYAVWHSTGNWIAQWLARSRCQPRWRMSARRLYSAVNEGNKF